MLNEVKARERLRERWTTTEDFSHFSSNCIDMTHLAHSGSFSKEEVNISLFHLLSYSEMKVSMVGGVVF